MIEYTRTDGGMRLPARRSYSLPKRSWTLRPSEPHGLLAVLQALPGFFIPSTTPIPHVPYLLVKNDATFSTYQCKKAKRGMVRSRLDMRTAKRAGKKREGMDGSRPSLSV